MTGILQTHARKYQTAIDQLEFSFRISDIDKETCLMKPQVYIIINLLGWSIHIWSIFRRRRLGQKKKVLNRLTCGKFL